MRKVLVVACVMTFLVSAVAIIGCGGGDTEQARGFVKQGDELAEERGSRNTELINAWQAVRETDDPAAKAAAWEEAEGVYREISELVQAEKAEYAKIMELKGVEDYVKYAELKTEELDAFEQMLNATNDFLDKLANNGFGSEQELEAASQEYQAEAQRLQDENARANSEAEQLKNDKNL